MDKLDTIGKILRLIQFSPLIGFMLIGGMFGYEYYTESIFTETLSQVQDGHIKIMLNESMPTEFFEDKIFREYYTKMDYVNVYFGTQKNVQLKCRSKDAFGCYHQTFGGDNNIYVSIDESLYKVKWALVHELAHSFYYNALSDEEIEEFAELINSSCYKSPTTYANEYGITEEFPEIVATYYFKGISRADIILDENTYYWLNDIFIKYDMPLADEVTIKNCEN